uniref:coiled-coil domain-containing protein 171-like n=1 Tax=Agelaius phoeniceus TaxID=39638 RepID=UPI0023ED1444|nr:coiled-coil domain-containing protein 171-like [Agelaius phoeniceus]
MNDRYQQKASGTEKRVQSDQWQFQEEQQRFAMERDNIHRVHLAELEFLFKEKAEAAMAFQKTNAALQSIAKKLKDMEAEHNGCTKVLKLQAACLEIKNKRQERFLQELEAAAVKTKELEDDAVAARRAHVECKYTTEVMQFMKTAFILRNGAEKEAKLYGLEQLSDKLAQENNSLKNSLLDAFKARSSLLAACALLSGALCSLYGRLCATSCQRDILQERVNQHQLLNHKIVSLLYALPAVVERNQDEGRLRQRRAKNLVYAFRRAVIAVLAANRLRALARYSCTFFVWTDGCRGSSGIQVCLGESRGRHPVPYSELWLSSNLLIGTARNCFAQLMDNLSVLMETVQGNARGCRAYLERDSLIERLARGLQRGLPDTAEELRKRDQVLDQQEKLLKDMEKDQKRLWETLQEAERALEQGVKDKELIISQMKAVEAALNEEEVVDNSFYKQLENVSGASAIFLAGNFNLPDIFWELNTAEKRQSRKFLEFAEDNFLSELHSGECLDTESILCLTPTFLPLCYRPDPTAHLTPTQPPCHATHNRFWVINGTSHQPDTNQNQ